MTDQTIIDDAKAAGLSFLGVKSSDRWKALFDFVAIREARTKADASKQVQGEAIAWTWKARQLDGKILQRVELWNPISEYVKNDDYTVFDVVPLFTAPPQTQTLADALEMAAKICDEQSKRHGDKANEEDDEVECSILKSTAWQFSIAAHDIRNLITTQSTQVQIPDGLKLVPIEPTAEMSSFNNTGVHWQIAESIYKAMLEAAPSVQVNTEGEK